MSAWRLLTFGTYNAFMNMAIDEAMLRARIENHAPNTVRFYCWKPSAVSVGRFQSINNEVYLDNCRKRCVDVVRRISGGGTVYHDVRSEITYSVVADKKDLGASEISTVYSKIYSGLDETIKVLGLRADFNKGNVKTCPNLTVNDMKISGSAQSHKKGVVLQHGTLLVDVDLEKMFTLLRVQWAKTCMEVVNVAKSRITSIKKELRRDVSISEVYKALVTGFQRALNIKLVESKLTYYEKELAEKLYKEKYATDNWNFHGRTN